MGERSGRERVLTADWQKVKKESHLKSATFVVKNLCHSQALVNMSLNASLIVGEVKQRHTKCARFDPSTNTTLITLIDKYRRGEHINWAKLTPDFNAAHSSDYTTKQLKQRYYNLCWKLKKQHVQQQDVNVEQSADESVFVRLSPMKMPKWAFHLLNKLLERFCRKRKLSAPAYVEEKSSPVPMNISNVRGDLNNASSTASNDSVEVSRGIEFMHRQKHSLQSATPLKRVLICAQLSAARAQEAVAVQQLRFYTEATRTLSNINDFLHMSTLMCGFKASTQQEQ